MNHDNENLTQPRVDAGRRRLFRGVGGGAGVLMTVGAKTALASATCQSPSARMSGNTSPRPGTGATCSGGLSPGYWMVPDHAGNWPRAGGAFPTFNITLTLCAANLNDIKNANITNKGTVLSSVFSGAPNVAMWYALYAPTDTATFGTTEKGQLLRHLSAAWLNAGYFSLAAAQYPLTKAQVVAMWNAVKLGGTYCPPSLTGCANPWRAADVISYIEGIYDINATAENVCKAA